MWEEVQPMRGSKRIKCRVPTSVISDGGKFEARTVNVSTSGAFLRTHEQPAVGGQLDVVVQGFSRPTHLQARVVRTQTGSLPGIGIAWTRAVTCHGPAALVSFLSSFLHTAPAFIQPHVARTGDLTVFEFTGWSEAAPATA
jgi:hypothetical protein